MQISYKIKHADIMLNSEPLPLHNGLRFKPHPKNVLVRPGPERFEVPPVTVTE